MLGPSGFTFGFEGEVAVLAHIGSNVGVSADVLLQHAGLLAANATLSTDVLPPAPPSHVHVLLIGLVP